MSKIQFLKNIDKYLGRILCAVLPAAGKPRKGKVEKVLIIRPGGIGDAVLLVPAIKLLRRQFPDVQIDILAEKRNSGVFDLVPEIHRVRHYDSLAGLFAVFGDRYDVIIDTEQWHRLSAVIARLVRSRVRIGFGTNERAKMFNYAVEYSHVDYEANSFMHLLQPVGVDISSPVAVDFLQRPDSSIQQKVDGLLSVLEDKPYVVLFPGGSISARQWGIENFSELAGLIAATGLSIVVVGGGQDMVAGDAILQDIGAGLNLAGQCDIAASAEIIARAQLLVSGDSGVLHIGVGLNRPTVSLFGPGIAKKWAPRAKYHRVINKQLECSPCTRFGYTPDCPYGVECMQQISVADVFAEVKVLLAQEGMQS
jgi:lipopolysaccharide heptosyltransferase II